MRCIAQSTGFVLRKITHRNSLFLWTKAHVIDGRTFGIELGPLKGFVPAGSKSSLEEGGMSSPVDGSDLADLESTGTRSCRQSPWMALLNVSLSKDRSTLSCSWHLFGIS